MPCRCPGVADVLPCRLTHVALLETSATLSTVSAAWSRVRCCGVDDVRTDLHWTSMAGTVRAHAQFRCSHGYAQGGVSASCVVMRGSGGGTSNTSICVCRATSPLLQFCRAITFYPLNSCFSLLFFFSMAFRHHHAWRSS